MLFRGRRVFESPARILGLTVSETDTGYNYATELLNSGAICLNMPTDKLAEEAARHFQERNVSSGCPLERSDAPVGAGERCSCRRADGKSFSTRQRL